jgi:pimeloyl-ACP methyl ester carboxylesterase
LKKQFILIHGAWHGGWCWEKVAAELEKAGHKVQAPTMPGHHPKDDRNGICLENYITQIVSTIEKAKKPVVLVGHSSAGFLIQSAAARVPEKIDHLIFNNAFILPHGNCQFDRVPPEVARGMTGAAAASPDNCVPVMEDFVRNTLMSDTPKQIQDELIARLVPQPLALFTTPVDLTGFERGTFGKTLLFCTRDQSLPEGAYLGMARALGHMDIIELDLDHEGLFTHPQQIAAGLLKAIANT